MIRTFKGRFAAAIWYGNPAKGFPADLLRPAQRKLAMLASAVTLDALRQSPGNHLESLKADRAGQHSIRINDQWRLCFIWHDGGADEVEIVDYH